MKKFLLFLGIAISTIFSGIANEVTFDFVNNTYGLTRRSGSTSEYDEIGTTVTTDGVTITFNSKNGTSTTNKSGLRLWSDGLRFYTGSYITITAPNNGLITAVQFKKGTTTGVNIGSGNNSTTKLTNGKWEGSSNSVDFCYTSSSSNQAISTITITYTPGSTSKVTTPEISIDKDFNVSITCATEGAKIYYDIDKPNLVPDQESTLYDENNKPNLLNEGPGTHTIKAVAYVDGVASGIAETSCIVPTIYNNVADVLALGVNSYFLLNCDMTVVLVAGNRVYITDGERNLYVNKLNDDKEYTAGMNLSQIEGSISYNASNGLYALVTRYVAGNAKVNYPVTPVTDLAQIDGENLSARLFDVVTIDGCSLAETGTARQYTLTLGDKETLVYNDGNINMLTGDNLTVTGVVITYKEALEIIPMSVTESATGRTESGLSFDEEVVNIYFDNEAFVGLDLNNPKTIDVIWTVTGDNIIEEFEEGVVVINGNVGTAVITAKPADAEAYVGTASYTLNVNKRPVTLSFSADAVTVEEDDMAEAPVLTVSPAVKVEYTSSDATVATADAEYVYGHVPGTAVITAKPVNDNYECTPATYTVTVTAKPVIPAVTVTIGDTTYDEGVETEIVAGTGLVISAPTAETITIDIEDGEKIVSQGETYTWTPAVGDYTATITATNAVGTSEEFYVFLTVTKAPYMETKSLYWNFTKASGNSTDLVGEGVDLTTKNEDAVGTWHVQGSFSGGDGTTLSNQQVYNKKDMENPVVIFGSSKGVFSGTFTLNGVTIPENAKNAKLTLGMESNGGSAKVCVTISGDLTEATYEWSGSATYSPIYKTASINPTDGIVSFSVANGAGGFFLYDARLEYEVEVPDAEIMGFTHEDPEVGEDYVTFKYYLHVNNHHEGRGDSYKVKFNLYEKSSGELAASKEVFDHSVVADPAFAPAFRANEAAVSATHKLQGEAKIEGLKTDVEYTAKVQYALADADYPDEVAVDAPIATGIYEVGVDREGAAEWYDLAGRRVAAPGKGIYVKKCGAAATKYAF